MNILGLEARHEIILRTRTILHENANEAETRKTIIDTILYEVLGWQKDDVSYETHIPEDGNHEYIDYNYSTANTHILVEAKRISSDIDLSSLPSHRRVALKGKWLSSDAGAAVIQARDYARVKGAGFAIATNGSYWIIFPINRRDGVSFENSYCLIFRNIVEVLDSDFEQFYDLLSRSQIIDGSLDKTFLGGENDQVDSRRLNRIHDTSFSQNHNEGVFSHIESAIVTAFSDDLVNSNTDLLEKSYVKTPERTKFDHRIGMHIVKRDNVTSHRPIKAMTRSGAAEAVRSIQRKVTSRPIALLTLGLVGSGKTTFLNYISKVSAKHSFSIDASDRSSHWIYIDFRDFTSDQKARQLILETAFDYIKEHPFLKDYDRCVRHAYKGEIEALSSGPMALLVENQSEINRQISAVLMEDFKQKIPYAESVLKYAAKNTSVFIVVDNVDQIDPPELQSSIFLDALAVARNLKCNLVLAMRDSTYTKSRHLPIFDAFDFDTAYIEAPNILEVLSKRFSIASSILDGQSFDFVAENSVKVHVANSRIIVDWLKTAILGTEVGKLIEVAATGDTRLALRMTRQFLQYGYSSQRKAVQILQTTGKYDLPPHEALRAIMFGNQPIYKDEHSSIANIFDAKLNRTDAQFLRLFVVSALVNHASENAFTGVEALDVIKNLEKIGFSERISESVIRDLMERRLVYSSSHQTYHRETLLIPSRFAGYITKELMSRFVFIETSMFDTFISDNDAWAFIRDNMKKVYTERNKVVKFRLRKQAVERFYAYCEDQFNLLVFDAQKRGLSSYWSVNPLTRDKKKFYDDADRALQSATRTYSTTL